MKIGLLVALVISVLMRTSAMADDTATLRVESLDFKAQVSVNGKELGSVSDLQKEFTFPVRIGPTVVELRSERFNTVLLHTFEARLNGVYILENVAYSTKYAKEITGELKCSDLGKPVPDKEGIATIERKLYREKYPRTSEFWTKVIAANTAARERFDSMGIITWEKVEKENVTHLNLLAEFERFDDTGVDPELREAFKLVREAYKIVINASYAMDKKTENLMLIFGTAYASGGTSLLGMPSTFSDCRSAGDVAFIAHAQLRASVKRLNALLEVMEYRYGKEFAMLDPALKKIVTMITAGVRDTWFDKPSNSDKK